MDDERPLCVQVRQGGRDLYRPPQPVLVRVDHLEAIMVHP
jgi:hypothetical protein